MKKVMLVDDEILIRESIRECVDWAKEGFFYCGDASDGELALPIIEEQMPDILITDIKMPFMNGLELSSVVRQKFPKIKIIILSGHDDFRYAQSALRLGVEDYCLKPFSSTDLLQLLQRVSIRIDDELRIKHKYAYTPDKLFADLCGGLISTAVAIESAEQLALPLVASYYACAIFVLNPTGTEDHKEDTPQDSTALLLNLLEQWSDGFTYKRSRTEVVLIYKGNDPENMTQMLEALSTSLKHKLRTAYGCELSVSLGSVQERLQGIHRSYVEAENDRMAMMSRQDTVALLDPSFDYSSGVVLVDRSRLIQFLKLGDSKQTSDFLQQFAEDLKGINWKSVYAYYLLNDLTLELVQTARTCFRAAANPVEMISALQQQIRNIASMEECLSYLTRLFEQLWKWRSEGSDKYRELIDKVKQYILEHYDNEQLALHDISRQVGVSSSHLSKIFSQESGQTMTEFLTTTRIAKAKELLKTTGSKTFEIAFSVGYNDQHYFSNLFKKVTGMTPVEYRKHGKLEDQFPLTQKGASVL